MTAVKPCVLVPMGDPAGIGPEILVKALANAETVTAARCVAVGDRRVLANAAACSGLALEMRTVKAPRDTVDQPGVINVLEVPCVDWGALIPGHVDAMCGKAAYDCIAAAIAWAMDGKADAVATTPINKESLRAAGVPYIGHTEIFGALTGTADPLTMFQVRNLRVFFLSRHVSLRDACALVTKERIVDYVRRCIAALRQLGVGDGVMAIAGLNPHSGEHGLFGTEEMEAVVPAVEQLQKEGYAVEGPVSADSVFHLALKGKYHSVLSLYHDQGHVATKTLDFERTISVTAGMPILRTSVDHGTAFDIAWQNRASAVSMVEAIAVAAKYAPFFRRG